MHATAMVSRWTLVCLFLVRFTYKSKLKYLVDFRQWRKPDSSCQNPSTSCRTWSTRTVISVAPFLSEFRWLSNTSLKLWYLDVQVYTQLVMEGEIVETPEGETPQAQRTSPTVCDCISCITSRHVEIWTTNSQGVWHWSCLPTAWTLLVEEPSRKATKCWA